MEYFHQKYSVSLWIDLYWSCYRGILSGINSKCCLAIALNFLKTCGRYATVVIHKILRYLTVVTHLTYTTVVDYKIAQACYVEFEKFISKNFPPKIKGSFST